MLGKANTTKTPTADSSATTSLGMVTSQELVGQASYQALTAVNALLQHQINRLDRSMVSDAVYQQYARPLQGCTGTAQALVRILSWEAYQKRPSPLHIVHLPFDVPSWNEYKQQAEQMEIGRQTELGKLLLFPGLLENVAISPPEPPFVQWRTILEPYWQSPPPLPYDLILLADWLQNQMSEDLYSRYMPVVSRVFRTTNNVSSFCGHLIVYGAAWDVFRRLLSHKHRQARDWRIRRSAFCQRAPKLKKYTTLSVTPQLLSDPGALFDRMSFRSNTLTLSQWLAHVIPLERKTALGRLLRTPRGRSRSAERAEPEAVPEDSDDSPRTVTEQISADKNNDLASSPPREEPLVEKSSMNVASNEEVSLQRDHSTSVKSLVKQSPPRKESASNNESISWQRDRPIRLKPSLKQSPIRKDAPATKESLQEVYPVRKRSLSPKPTPSSKQTAPRNDVQSSDEESSQEARKTSLSAMLQQHHQQQQQTVSVENSDAVSVYSGVSFTESIGFDPERLKSETFESAWEIHTFLSSLLPLAHVSHEAAVVRDNEWTNVIKEGGRMSLNDMEKWLREYLCAELDEEKGQVLYKTYSPVFSLAFKASRTACYKAPNGAVKPEEFRQLIAYVSVYALAYDSFYKIDAYQREPRGKISLRVLLAGYSQAMEHGFHVLHEVAKEHFQEKAITKIYNQVDSRGIGSFQVADWCHFIRDSEITAGTTMGTFLRSDNPRPKSSRRGSLSGERRRSMSGERRRSIDGERRRSIDGERRRSFIGRERRNSVGGERRKSIGGAIRRLSLGGLRRKSFAM